MFIIISKNIKTSIKINYLKSLERRISLVLHTSISQLDVKLHHLSNFFFTHFHSHLQSWKRLLLCRVSTLLSRKHACCYKQDFKTSCKHEIIRLPWVFRSHLQTLLKFSFGKQSSHFACFRCCSHCLSPVLRHLAMDQCD